MSLFFFPYISGNGFFFSEYLHVCCKGKSEIFTKFQTSLVVTKTKKDSFWPAKLAKDQHKMHYHRAFTCKKDVTLAYPKRKICCIFGFKHLS